MTANGLPPLSLLAGRLAPASLLGYGRDLAAYARFCTRETAPLQAASLASQEQTPENLR